MNFVSYSTNFNTYRLYDSNKDKIITSCNVRFLNEIGPITPSSSPTNTDTNSISVPVITSDTMEVHPNTINRSSTPLPQPIYENLSSQQSSPLTIINSAATDTEVSPTTSLNQDKDSSHGTSSSFTSASSRDEIAIVSPNPTADDIYANVIGISISDSNLDETT